MSQGKEKILDVGLSSTSKDEVLDYVSPKLRNFNGYKSGWKKFLITTPNPEIVNLAQSDLKLKKILNKADLSLPDGIGLLAASKFLSLPNPKSKLFRFFTLLLQGCKVGLAVLFKRDWLRQDLNLIHGRKMFVDLVKLANDHRWRIVLYGSKGSTAQLASKKLSYRYRKVKIEALEAPMYRVDGKPKTKEDIDLEKYAIEKINRFKPHILFVGIQPPKQEKWLDRNWGNLDIGGAMVAGGAFDHISGEVKSPPGFIESLEMEWLWRLFSQTGRPRNIRRVFDSVIVFPLRVFKYKLQDS